MRQTKAINNFIINHLNMDFVGIAPASALAGEPTGHRPEELLPGAKSIIVFGRAFADGAVQSMFRAFESKFMQAQSSYAAYCNDLAPNFLLVNDSFELCCYLEDQFGVIAAPMPFNVQQSMVWDNVPGQFFADPYGQGMPLDIYKAAMAAGIGEFGWSNRLLTPKYGPRQMLSAVITTMEFEYDKPYSGPRLCDPEACGICSKICPTGAIPSVCEGKCREKAVGGKSVSVADINANSCTVASLAFRKEFKGRTPVPDLILHNDPSDEELCDAFEKKPLNGLSIEHYPRYFCERCLIYCPVGDWKARFYDTAFTAFDPDKLKKTT